MLPPAIKVKSMIMRVLSRVCALIALMTISLVGTAQRQLTMEEAVLAKGGQLYPMRYANFQWRPLSGDYTYVQGDTLVLRNVASQKDLKRIPLRHLNALLPSNASKLSSWYPLTWHTGQELTFWTGTLKYSVDADFTKVAQLCQLPKEADNIHEAPARDAVVYNIGQSLELQDAAGKRMRVITDTLDGIQNGRAVHRNEFGIEDGIFWSPKGEAFAFYHMDERMVTPYPLVDISDRPAKLAAIRYPMAGQESHQVTVGVVHVDNPSKIVWLQTGLPKEKYLTNLAWSPDAKLLYIAEVNRGQDTMNLVEYDALSGARRRVLFQETDTHYVEPLVPMRFLPNRPGEFIWMSQRSGHNHAYLYNVNGQLIAPVTSGNWDVLEVLGYDKQRSTLYIYSNENAVLDRQLVAVNVVDKSRKRLTPKDGYTTVWLDTQAGRFAARWSSVHDAGGFYISSLRGGPITNERKHANPLEGYAIPQVRLVSLKAADGTTDLYGRLITPPNMDSTQKHKVVVYVYGGPHAQLVTNTWLAGGNLWECLMAQQGYVVFVLDNRGSANRGFAFEQPIHRRLGQLELQDQLKGVEYLKSLPYVDSERMAVHGWSFGGFMTINMLLKSDNAFKVGVAGGPVIDWQYYEIMYGERYMDRPQENPDGYAWANLRRSVRNLEGKRLLLLHGYQDNTVVPQHSLSFMKAVVDAGRYEVDAFFYPGHAHNVRGLDRVQLMAKVTDYINRWL